MQLNLRNYIKAFVGTVAVLLLASAAINIVIDPYGLHRWIESPQFNERKMTAATSMRMVKAYRIRQIQPNAIMVGTSRVDMGFDPDKPGRGMNLTIFNAGILGSSMYEQLRYLQHAQAVGPLEYVVLGTDFISFNTKKSLTESDFLEGRLAMRYNGESTFPLHIDRLTDFMRIYFSLQSLSNSYRTVTEQQAPSAATMTSGGFNPMLEQAHVTRHGYHHMFTRKNRSTLNGNLSRAEFSKRLTHEKMPIEYLQDFIYFCRENDITLDIYIQPFHAHLLESLDILGHWPEYENWKRQLTYLVANDNRLHRDKAQIALWDFGTYNSITTESVPEKGDKLTPMKFFWESSHYKSLVGDEVMFTMYMDSDASFGLDENDFWFTRRGIAHRPGPPIADFGVLLTPENIESELLANRQQRQQYRRDHENDIRELRALRVDH